MTGIPARPLHSTAGVRAGKRGIRVGALLLFIALAGPAGASDLRTVLGAAEAVQHIQLPGVQRVRVRVYGLQQRVEIQVVQGRKGIGTVVAEQVGGASLCRLAQALGATVELRCQSPRLQAVVRRTKAGLGVDILELRGLPWSSLLDGVPPVGYHPRDLGYRGLCPGKEEATRGECAFREGKYELAERAFRDAIGTPTSGLARMRLGDLAWLRGDISEAAMHWSAVRAVGMVRRLTDMRLSELRGDVVEEGPRFERLYDVKALTDPVRAEVELRAARVRAFHGRPIAAVRGLLDSLNDVPVPRACRLAPSTCKSIALAALRAAHEEDEIQDVLLFYLALPDRFEAPLAVELADAAADRALAIGATGFAANLLAAVSSQVRPEDLSDHLLRTAALYRQAGDDVRADVVIRYARERLPPRLLSAPAWRSAIAPTPKKRVARPRRTPAKGPKIDVDAAKTATAIADALLVQARARRLQSKQTKAMHDVNLTPRDGDDGAKAP
ncbi:MAG: hypothetical protein D6729_06435 [Deltaproteobacteria bacterium]|nr:MAG: hypothetical protein D6729_06435 [Deltaproteobacteria bacterium]